MSDENTTDQIMRRVMRLVGHCLARGRLRLVTSGIEHIPVQGPGLLVARHYHHLYDGIALHWAIPRRLHLLVTLDWADDPITRWIMESLNRAARWPVVLRADALERIKQTQSQKSMFTAKDLRRYQRRAIADAVTLLEENRLLVVFPEGYPNVDPHYTPKRGADEMLPFKLGFAAIAAAAEKRAKTTIPLIPVGISYDTGAKWTARVKFGEALHPHDFPDRNALASRLEEEVAKLAGLRR